MLSLPRGHGGCFWDRGPMGYFHEGASEGPKYLWDTLPLGY